jgi:type IV pilus assembly protein PilM
MVQFLLKPRCSPIGVDLGSRSVKLLQLSADRSAVSEAARWDLPAETPEEPEQRAARVAEAIRRAMDGRGFRGREAVFCLGAEGLFVQNIRVAQAQGENLERIVLSEAAGRLPFRCEEAEVRFVEAADVRQGDAVRREVILMACHRPVVQRILELAERTRLKPVAIDAEPTALLRCYAKQFRRDDDQQRRLMFVSIGASTTKVVIARGADAIFVKYVDTGGRHLDEAVARHLNMPAAEAAALRRHNGDRRADQRDPEVTRSLAESVRPVLDRLAQELAMCLRYHSVTFRGQPIWQIVLGGGEASEGLADYLKVRLDLPCELGNPLRSYEKANVGGRIGQWDVAAGLALRQTR